MINIIEMLERAAEEYGEKTAYLDPYKEITFKELLYMAKKTATHLADIRGRNRLKPESALAFYMEKSVDALIVMFAGMYLGDFYSFIDIRQTKNRAESIISVLEPEFIITDEINYGSLNNLTLSDENKRSIVLISDLLTQAKEKKADEDLLSEIRTVPLVRIIALSIPLSCVHSCLNGYFLGCKKAAISASTFVGSNENPFVSLTLASL